MLGVGDPVPGTIPVWTQPGRGPQPLADALAETAGAELVLLCFYLFDWSPT